MTLVPLRDKKIGIVGFGTMAEAIVKGLLGAFTTTPNMIVIRDLAVDRLTCARNKYGLTVAADLTELIASTDIALLAVKPQDLPAVMKEARRSFSGKTLIVSILAGVPTRKIETLAKAKVHVIRAMPNLGAVIASSISAITRGRYAQEEDLFYGRTLLRAVGEVVEVEENLLDSVTAVSGSGPAYYFYLTELLIENGLKQGLSVEVSRRLAYATLEASARLVKELATDPATLRKRVTSKGGTTEAAFAVFERAKLDKIVANAIAAAKRRAEKLAKE